jgi:hypothetical protein
VEAQLLGVVKCTTDLVLVLKAGETAFDASIDAASASPELEDIRAGSRVAVSGEVMEFSGLTVCTLWHKESPAHD